MTQLTISDAPQFRIASWNIRYDSRPDNVTVAQTLANLPSPLTQPVYLNKSGEQPWSDRRVKVLQQLKQQGVSLIGFQEVLLRQVRDLQELLGDDWAYIGVGRDDGKTAGEFSPIFFKRYAVGYIKHQALESSEQLLLHVTVMGQLLALVNASLSARDFGSLTIGNRETPFVPSKYPGAGSYRVATAAKFQLNDSAIRFFLVNTHLDDQSDAQRRLGASLLLHRLKHEAAKDEDAPVLITGDFNSQDRGSSSGAYSIVVGSQEPVKVNEEFHAKFPLTEETKDFKMIDTRAVTPRIAIGGNHATFTGFGNLTRTSSWTRIDFVLGGNNGGWSSDAYWVGEALSDDGVLSSDHRPVFCDLTLSHTLVP